MLECFGGIEKTASLRCRLDSVDIFAVALVYLLHVPEGIFFSSREVAGAVVVSVDEDEAVAFSHFSFSLFIDTVYVSGIAG